MKQPLKKRLIITFVLFSSVFLLTPGFEGKAQELPKSWSGHYFLERPPGFSKKRERSKSSPRPIIVTKGKTQPKLPKGKPVDFSAPNPHRGRPSIVLPQERVGISYIPFKGRARKAISRLSPHNDEKYQPRKYVDSSPIWEMTEGVSSEDEEGLGYFLHAQARGLVQKAMLDQGYKPEPYDKTAENLLLANLGDYRLPSVGLTRSSYYNNSLSPGGTRKVPPQISVSYYFMQLDEQGILFQVDKQRGMFFGEFFTIVGHEYEHSLQLENPWFDPSKGTWLDISNDLYKRIDNQVERRPSYRFIMEIPTVFRELVTYSAMHRAQTGKKLDTTITFPSGKQIPVPTLERLARANYAFSPDPATGQPRSFTELLATPMGVQWISQLYGPGKGSVTSGFGKIQKHDFSPEGLRAIQNNPDVKAFLQKLKQ